MALGRSEAIPLYLVTDCKSLYDVCTKNGSMPEERRVALDLLDVRESIEKFGDKIRWIPTDHMLVDCMTKNMPPDAMVGYMKSMEYAFKHDDVIKQTKREVAKMRLAKRVGDIPKELDKLELDDLDSVEDVNIIDHYPLYLAMFSLLYRTGHTDASNMNPTINGLEKFRQDRKDNGYRHAYRALLVTLTSEHSLLADDDGSSESSS